MGSDPKTSGVSMVKIGEALKEAREKKSFTIDQVQKQTRIHETVLKALEEGRCDGILTPTYVKSFLKKYAEYLGLDARQMLAEYAKLRPASSAQAASMSLKSKTETVPPPDLSKYFPAAKRVAVAVIAIAVVMFVGGKAVKGLKQWRQARATAAAKAQAKNTRTVPAPSKKRQASQSSAAAKKEPAAKEQPQAKPAALAPSAQPQAKAAAIPSPAAIPKAAPLKLVISVKQTVLVKVKADGNLLFSSVLTRGSTESFSAKDRFNIYVAKGEAVGFFLNGKNLAFSGRGPVKDVEITRSGLKVR